MSSRLVAVTFDAHDAAGLAAFWGSLLGREVVRGASGAELLFQVLTEREEKNSIAIASNQSFSGWTDTFTDPRLCAAIVDRLTYHGTIIETGTHSYRLAHARSTHGYSQSRRGIGGSKRSTQQERSDLFDRLFER